MRKQILAIKNLGGRVLLVLAALFILAPAAALADSYPYFKVTGGDSWAGGWFNKDTSSSNTCDTSDYQDAFFPSSSNPDFSSTFKPRYGGIDAYAQQSGGKYQSGASDDFGAYALGQVVGGTVNNGGNTGFASGTAGSGSYSALTFAKPTAGNWGGMFEGSSQQIHCIPDYYDTLSSFTSTKAVSSLNSIGGTGVYTISSGSGTPVSLDSGAWQVPASSQITVYVNGPAYIGSPITYPSGITVSQVPKFALVVKGSLYISPGVGQLDGLYIAQPDLSDSTALKDDTGEIWTCHDDSTTNPVPNSYPLTSCDNSLAVNGAMIAKRVNMLRTGNIATSSLSEAFNYTPAMVINGPFFNQSDNSSLKIESLVSLPPVF